MHPPDPRPPTARPPTRGGTTTRRSAAALGAATRRAGAPSSPPARRRPRRPTRTRARPCTSTRRPPCPLSSGSSSAVDAVDDLGDADELAAGRRVEALAASDAACPLDGGPPLPRVGRVDERLAGGA